MTFPVGPVDGATATLPSSYIPPTAATNGAAGQAGASGASGEPMLDPQAFLQLLVAQLKYQDPTNPVDTSNFMNQTAMLSQVQTITNMASTMAEMVAAQQTQAATAMIGKQITFLDPSGEPAAGVVSAVSVHSGVSMLHVGDLAVPLSGVLEVTSAPDPAAPAPAAGTTDPSGAGSTETGSTDGDATTGTDAPASDDGTTGGD